MVVEVDLVQPVTGSSRALTRGLEVDLRQTPRTLKFVLLEPQFLEHHQPALSWLLF